MIARAVFAWLATVALLSGAPRPLPDFGVVFNDDADLAFLARMPRSIC